MAKLSASALLENVIALLIISVIVSIALSFFVTVTSSDKNKQKLEASLLVKQLYEESLLQKTFFNKESNVYGYQIQKEVTNYDDIPNLYKVSFSVFNKQDQFVYDHHFLIINE